MSLTDAARYEEEIAELRRALNNSMRAEAKARARSEELVAAVYTAARDAAMAYGKPSAVRAAKRDRRQGRGEVALVHTTDWQLGKRSEGYSPDVCSARIMDFADKVGELTAIQRAARPVRDVTVMLGGDMIEGVTIFPSQAFEVSATLFDQVFMCARLIEDFVRRLLTEFETVTVFEEYGNHGRIGRRGELPAGDNLDRMAYRIAAERFADDARVTWHPSTSWYSMVTVGNYRALLVHGDEVKSFGGNVPAFGIMRKVNAWATGVVEPFTDAYLGHYHQVMTLSMANGGRVFVTGSPESHNEYAREFVAATGQPSQRLHFVDPEKGRVTSEHVVWL